ncbi:cell wall metabolism sensor histidine kinase WalK [Loigolactobacillus backii]|uniref:histidine kinase n=1 Tax=Loigolactobacillus backii TaxID=375175 RepID=A0A192H1M4_9LACO|nr:cell wall metabolism sensor histidine kinase WalK [Loigolactobacillus backii]ANK60585.1 PAS domain-containing sensor histidine kinase [Loigolactobacillus backii]ANK61846.1 PAS domain-containing sensor histidine kinase [Loigolactobacillus backii]ANK65538.1 PAS domain-containing sensor histidine kinase [Loigolactobacillus backii]ANK68009.1 PAS domain-containing sensor histidine kinase [Loigolactobacillus backii]ANK68960.1 PAS domain-containing sensor histidine kinase [Loigolactobacillus backi
MNKKIHFFQSINFKIALVFILLLMVTLEIIGAYFVKQLEQQNIQTFKQQVQTPAYVNNQLADDLLKTDATSANKEIGNVLADLNNSADIRVVDSKGIIRGTSDVNDQGEVGQKTPDSDVKNVLYNNRSYETLSYDKKNQASYYVTIVPLINPSGDSNSVVGAIYVRANMESVYKGINSITIIFLTASLVAALFSSVIAIVISRAITRPIDEMKKQAIRMARGDYSGQVRIYGQDELGQLAVAVNNLSVRVEEAQEASEAERRRLDSVLSHMTDGVISTDRRGNVIIINEAAADFLDVDDSAVIGQSILQILKIGNDHTIRDLLENQTELMLDFSSHEHDLILHAEFSLIQRETGFISGIVCVLHDVTEQQKDERERRQFVSNVSHELRTPLTSMRSYLEALTDGAWKDPKVAPDFLHVTQEETDRMIRMINDLLSLSRMDSGTVKMDMELVNLNELFNYVLNRFDMMIKADTSAADNNRTEARNLPANKKYSIKREFTKRDLWVEIDTDKFMQVIDNIMNNAIKYSPDGGVVTCRLLETNNHVILSISDQGLGIPKKDLPHVFDRFYRVDKARSRAQGGTGLGLAISKEVVEALNGRIWVDSEEGKGSTFYISLSYQPYDEEEDDLWDEN